MKIKCSKYNEVCLKDVKDFISKPCQIRKSYYNNGVFLGSVIIDGVSYLLHAGDDVCINNVWLSLAYGDFSYFDCVLDIN